MAPHTLQAPPRTKRPQPNPRLLTSALLILAQTNLEEHEARGEDEPEPDQHERKQLPASAADEYGTRSAGEHQQARTSKREDPRSVSHGGYSILVP
jgi:hypothetical protein